MPKTMMIKTDTEIGYTPQSISPVEYAVYVIIIVLIIAGIVIYLAKTKRKRKVDLT